MNGLRPASALLAWPLVAVVLEIFKRHAEGAAI